MSENLNSIFGKRRKFFHFIKSTGVFGSAKFSRLLAKVLMPLPKKAVWIETNYGFQMKVDPYIDRGVERSLFYFGVYEPGTLAIMASLLKPGNTFVDVGANIGLMSLRASLLVGKAGKVYSFEPNPKTNEILRENVAANKLLNITVESFALGSEKKSAVIYDRWDANRGAASLIKPSFETTSSEISQIPLDEYFPFDQEINLMKIDVEGFELEVLSGGQKLLRKETAPILIIECSSTRENTFGDSTKPLYDFIINLKHYRIFKLSQGKKAISKLREIKRFEDLPNHDNIFCLTDLHLAALGETILD